MNHEQHDANGSGGSRGKIVLGIFLGIAAFFLLTEHRAHVFGVLPFLLVLACPLMHMFMHGGHGSHGSHGGHSNSSGDRAQRPDDGKEA